MSKKKNMQAKSLKFWDGRQNALGFCAMLFFILIMVVYPIYLSPEKYVGLTGHKAHFYWLVTGIMAGVFIILLLYYMIRSSSGGYLNPDAVKRRISIPEWALLAFLLLVFLSSVFSVFQDVVWKGYTERFEGFWTYICYGAAFFIMARFYRPKNWHFFLFAASAIIISFIGIMQFTEHDIIELFPYRRYDFLDPVTGRPQMGGISVYFRSTLGNIDIVSAYCALTVILFAALYAAEKSVWRFLHLAATILSFFLMLIAGADAGKIGILAAMVLLIPYWISRRARLGRILVSLSGWCLIYAVFQTYLQRLKFLAETNPPMAVNDASFLQNSVSYRSMIPFWILGVVLLAAGLCLLIVLKKREWPERKLIFAGGILLIICIVGGILSVEVLGARWSDNPHNIVFQAREMLHGRLEDNFGSNRGWIWKNAVAVFPENPALGTGPDTFYYALGDTRQQESIEKFLSMCDKAHNSLLQILVCTGLPSMIAYLVFTVSLFVMSVKKAFSNPLILAAGGCTLSYFVQSLFGVDVPIAAPLFWAMLGILAGEIWREHEKALLSEPENPLELSDGKE